MNDINMDQDLERLCEFLQQAQPGNLGDGSPVANLLKKCWSCFAGSTETGMAPHKLERAEDFQWHPPVLAFRIERHGATVRGSTRAELYTWKINTETLQAECTQTGRRQVRPMAQRLDVASLAREIVGLILGHSEDPRLKWYPDGKVQVFLNRVIPEGFKQTTANRRARFGEELEELMVAEGWELVRKHVYRKRPSESEV